MNARTHARTTRMHENARTHTAARPHGRTAARLATTVKEAVLEMLTTARRKIGHQEEPKGVGAKHDGGRGRGAAARGNIASTPQQGAEMRLSKVLGLYVHERLRAVRGPPVPFSTPWLSAAELFPGLRPSAFEARLPLPRLAYAEGRRACRRSCALAPDRLIGRPIERKPQAPLTQWTVIHTFHGSRRGIGVRCCTLMLTSHGSGCHE
jgi:hypothetical protein